MKPFVFKNTSAFFLFKRVLPRKVPRPRPDLEDGIFDFIYGSPKISKISFGNPNPSSSIIMLKVSLSLSTDTVVKFLENFIELPIKFLIPYTASGVLSNLNLLKSFLLLN